jgi:Na+-driven multidrug efflux pump
MVAGGILRGSGDTRAPAAIQIGLAYGVFLPLAYFGMRRTAHGPIAGWSAATIYILILGIALYWRYRRGAWASRVLIKEQPAPGEAAAPPGPECIGPPVSEGPLPVSEDQR